MFAGKIFGRTVLLSFITISLSAAEKREWKEGILVHREVVGDAASRRYEYVVSDLTYRYTIQYESPLKTVPRQTVKFVIQRDQLILLDADGKERPSHIEQREKEIYDPARPNTIR